LAANELQAPAFMLQIINQLIKPEILVEIEIIAARK
jgi:hypothetical protein